MRPRKGSFRFSKRKNCTAGIIRRKRIWWGESPILSPSTMLNALIPPCNIKLRNRQRGITGSKKRNPQKYENSGFGFGLFSFLHFDFSIFLFGCPVATKEVNHENVAWILGFRHRKRGRNLDVSFLSSKFRPLSTWCRWPDSNRYGVATGGFWVHYVYQFHHTGLWNRNWLYNRIPLLARVFLRQIAN